MTLPTWACWTLLTAVVLERASELPLARRNTRALLARGGVEIGASHYPFIVAVHVLWLCALAAWIASSHPALQVGWAIVYVALQSLRFWVMHTLGPYWTTRIISVPDAPLIRCGPYRFLKHPNYVVVTCEIAVLPLAVGAWQLALIFSMLNAAVLTVRLRAEDAALHARVAAAAAPPEPARTADPASATLR